MAAIIPSTSAPCRPADTGVGSQFSAFCLLVNHLHLLVTPREQPLWRMMQQLNSTYCSWFNQRHERVGHVLQGRYKSKLIDDCAYFLNATRYLALNPVVAQQVEHPEDWWSSYRAAIGLATTPCARSRPWWTSIRARSGRGCAG